MTPEEEAELILKWQESEAARAGVYDNYRRVALELESIKRDIRDLDTWSQSKLSLHYGVSVAKVRSIIKRYLEAIGQPNSPIAVRRL